MNAVQSELLDNQPLHGRPRWKGNFHRFLQEKVVRFELAHDALEVLKVTVAVFGIALLHGQLATGP